MNLNTFRSIRFCFILTTAVAMLAGCQLAPQRTYDSPQAAVDSLVDALRNHKQAELKRVLGRDSEEVIDSGDPVRDQQNVDRFLTAFDKKHEVVPGDGPGGSMTLVIGLHDWPWPIPLEKDKRGAWFFDTASGKDEILNRRIGHNERSAIQTCLAIADAQAEYAQRDVDGDGVLQYARKFFSSPGKKDGLYWPDAGGKDPSPLGELVADASDEGYTPGAAHIGEAPPYHGYHFRILTSQGSAALGGAYDYIVKGKMIGGFAIVAFPETYNNSGVMTFIINHQGVVYQRDLGPATPVLARAMTTFNPDESWAKVTAEATSSAAAQ